MTLIKIGSDDSSPMLTSDPTSDSSDTGGSGKSNEEPNSVNNGWDNSSRNNSESGNQTFQSQSKTDKTSDDSCEATENNAFVDGTKEKNDKKVSCRQKGIVVILFFV